jgi:hypothetical protein
VVEENGEFLTRKKQTSKTHLMLSALGWYSWREFLQTEDAGRQCPITMRMKERTPSRTMMEALWLQLSQREERR